MKTCINKKGVLTSFVASIMFLIATEAKALSNDEELWLDSALLLANAILENQSIQSGEQGRHDFPTQGLDLDFRRFAHGDEAEQAETRREKAFRHFSDSGVALLVGSSLGMWWWGEHLGSNLVPVHAYLLANFATSSLKLGLHRQRPRTYEGVAGEISEDDISSFPSGHSTNAFVAARLLSQSAGQNRSWVLPVAYGMAGAVAYGRIAADRHYLSDTLVGGLIGVGATYAGEILGRSNCINCMSIQVFPSLVSVRYRW